MQHLGFMVKMGQQGEVIQKTLEDMVILVVGQLLTKQTVVKDYSVN